MSKPKKTAIPYASTKVDPDTTILEIKKLLKSNNITDIQETTVAGETVIRFISPVEGHPVTFELRPPDIYAKRPVWNQKKGRSELTDVKMIAQAWRLLYWYLEWKFKTIKYGLVTVEREFMNQLVMPGDKTLGDIVVQRLKEDAGILKLDAPNDTSGLIDVKNPQRQVIDSNYKVVEK